MKIGYARTSTIDQKYGLDEQMEKLEAAGCEKIFSEQTSGKDTKRPKFQEMLAFVREGDIVITTHIDRLGRNTRDMLETVEIIIKERKASYKALEPAIDVDLSSPMGMMMFTMLAAISEMVRNDMLARQRAGIARAAAEGKYKGRKNQISKEKRNLIIKYNYEGMAKAKISREVGVSRRTVYNILEKTSVNHRHK